MCPVCVEQLRLWHCGLRPALVAVALAIAAGCGSLPEGTQPGAAATPPAEASARSEPPAAQTFPLDGETRPASDASVPSATSAPRKPSTTDSATPLGSEPPLPPEAVRQFDDALAMLNAGNIAAAEQKLREMSAAYPSYSGALVNLGILQAKGGKLEEAEKTLKAALERKPDNASAFNQLGIVYRRQGRFSEAEQAYTRAVQIDPNHATAHLNLGVLCDLYLQQPQRALEAFERYLSLTSSPDEKVTAWVKELKVRLESAQRGSGAG